MNPTYEKVLIFSFYSMFWARLIQILGKIQFRGTGAYWHTFFDDTSNVIIKHISEMTSVPWNSKHTENSIIINFTKHLFSELESLKKKVFHIVAYQATYTTILICDGTIISAEWCIDPALVFVELPKGADSFMKGCCQSCGWVAWQYTEMLFLDWRIQDWAENRML